MKKGKNISRREAILSGAAALVGLSAASAVSGQTTNVAAKNVDAHTLVRQAILDYVEGIYEVDPKRIERSVHPDLAKRGYFIPRGKTAYESEAMSFAQLVEVSKKFAANKKPPADAPKEIVIFDVADQTASAKLVAIWGIDYFHLAKHDGKWMIVNVLWQSKPKS